MEEAINTEWKLKTPEGILNDMRRPYLLWKCRAHKQRVMPMRRKQLASFLRRERMRAKLQADPQKTVMEWLRGRK